MGTAYTPGLKVSPYTSIRTTRRLPLRGEVLVRVGDAVEPETVVARAELPGMLHAVRVASLLGVEPNEIRPHLRVSVEDRVDKGQLIAKSESFFGWLKSTAKSPIDGTVELINEASGNVGVRAVPLPIELTAYLKGTVAEVMPNDGVVIEAQGSYVQGIFGVGGERKGPIRVLAASPEEDLTAELITPDCAGSVLVGGRLITGEALQRASEVGVVALVAGGIIDLDLIAFVGHDIGVAITGDEDIPLTLITTEGFGAIPMARRTFDLFRALEGRMASVNGRTQIRAGVIRPEIVVPLEEHERPDLPPEPARQDLEIGATIRVIREPYFGILGTVSELPTELEQVPSGAWVRVLEADLQNGDRVTLPRANVEIVSG